MNVTNQKPVVLTPAHGVSLTGVFEPMDNMKRTVVAPLFTPLMPGAAVTIGTANHNITDDEINAQLGICTGDVFDGAAESYCKSILGKCLLNFDENTPLRVGELFAIQSACAEKLPWPSQTCVYTPTTDIIPAAKGFLAGTVTYDNFFANLAFYTRVKMLGFYFANAQAFDAFKTWFSQTVAAIASTLPSDTNQMVTDFNKLTLNGLTESLVIRNDYQDNNQDNSFARVLASCLMAYTGVANPSVYGCLPFDLGELFCPRNIVFVNVDAHAHATAKQIADEWNIITKSLNMKIQMISNAQLTKLTASTRAVQKAQAAAANALTNQMASVSRAGRIAFSKKRPKTIDVIKCVRKVLSKMATVAQSENIFKATKISFAKPNRRDPDDFNKPGKVVSTKYLPDIHIYLDTSGSISEENYQDAVKACIQIARKLNVNMYFNSFSNVLSQCTKLNLKDRSLKQIYARFQSVPKVSGGTDYEQIFKYINRSKKRMRELSIIITDFEWTMGNHFTPHPKNLYYLPCSCMNWSTIVAEAGYFCDSMKHIDPNIRSHILF